VLIRLGVNNVRRSVVQSLGTVGVMGTQSVGEERRQDRGGLHIRTYKAGGKQRQTKRCSVFLRDRRVRPHIGVPQRLGLGNLRRSVLQFSLGTDDSRVHTGVEWGGRRQGRAADSLVFGRTPPTSRGSLEDVMMPF
jgi:hypothetical protein